MKLPSQFGPYTLLRRLGAGGMAETFVAVRRGPGKFEQHLCIKRILPAYEQDREMVEHFLQEATIASRLQHRNIVLVFDVGVIDGSHYLALELIDGLDMSALLGAREGQKPPLSPEIVRYIASELCVALSVAHDPKRSDAPGGVVHRDLSPSNVLLSEAGEVKLADFGIAKAVGKTTRTQTGILKGKIPYMPAEYVSSAKFDARGDLYSLGVVMYEALAGVRPFDAHTPLRLLEEIAKGQYRPLSEIAPWTPESMAKAVDRLLQRDVDKRIQTATEAHELLGSLNLGPPTRARRELADMIRELRPRVSPEAWTEHAENRPQLQNAMELQAPQPEHEPQESGHPPAQNEAVRSMAQPVASQPMGVAIKRRGPLLRTVGFGLSGLLLLAVAALAGFWYRPSENPTPTRQTTEQASRNEKETQKTPVTPRNAAVPPPPSSVTGEQNGSATLRVLVVPYGHIWLGDKVVGGSRATLRLAPGTYMLRAGKEEPTERKSVRLKAGEHRRVVFHP